MPKRLVVMLALCALLVPSSAWAKGVPNCKSPRNTVDSVFSWQSGKQQSLVNATKCFEGGSRDQAQLEETARRLKTVFDAQGARIELSKISDDPDYLDEDHNPKLVPHDSLPKVTVEKREGRWQWTVESLDWIDQHYLDRLGWLDKVLDRLPAWAKLTVGDIALWQYAALAVLIVLGAAVSRLLHALLARRVKRRDEDSWQRKVVDVIAAPGATLVTAICLRLLYPELRLPVAVSATIHTLVRLLVTLAVVWAAYRGADVIAAKLAERAEKTESRLDNHLVPIVRKAVKFGVFLVGAIALLQNLSIDVTAVFATLGIGTLAVGLAAKDTLANFFGSLSIFVDNPFRIGDMINVDGVEGVVEEVGFRSTRLRTAYNSVVVFPNAKLADAKIDNWGQRQYRRTTFALQLVRGTTPEQIEALCEGICHVVRANPNARRDKCEAYLGALGQSGLEIQVCYFLVSDPELQEGKERHDILLLILGLARDLGIELAYPTQALHVESVVPAKERPAVLARSADELNTIVATYRTEDEPVSRKVEEDDD
jgi:MscS family membrane protein